VTSAVEFDFEQFSQHALQPGQRLLLVEDLAAFESAYPQAVTAVAGVYQGSLSNAGETIRVVGLDGQLIQEVTYDDDVNLGWPPAPDGGGPSLQAINPRADCALSNCNWRPSAVVGGTPGEPEYPVGDSNLDRLFNSSDLVQVFQAGRYETPTPDDATWAQGDWNGDRDFDSSDLVMAFQSGQYETGVRLASSAAPNAAPEVQPQPFPSRPACLPPSPPLRWSTLWADSTTDRRRRICHIDAVFRFPNTWDEPWDIGGPIRAAGGRGEGARLFRCNTVFCLDLQA
jgi:hypothetical protein